MERYDTPAEFFAAVDARPNDPVSFRGHFAAGLFVRTQVRAAIRAMELEPDIEVTWIEDKGLLGSYFTYRVSGRSQDVKAALETMLRMLPEED